jgi:hypothetical protein
MHADVEAEIQVVPVVMATVGSLTILMGQVRKGPADMKAETQGQVVPAAMDTVGNPMSTIPMGQVRKGPASEGKTQCRMCRCAKSWC